jgi:hypothetical protein
VNEHWGVANSKAPWSLWRINTLLGRKAISAGWNAKQLPPFRPIMELVLRLALPANILDGFRMFCPGNDLQKWVSSVSSYSIIKDVARQVFEQLCSARKVSKLRRLKERDIPLENIILFNRDALILAILTASIKRGDIGAVVNVLAHWMVMFRGSGKMPKYSDAMFRTIMDLKTMDPRLRYAIAIKFYLQNKLYLFNKACIPYELACQSIGSTRRLQGIRLTPRTSKLLAQGSIYIAYYLFIYKFTYFFLPKIIYNAKGSNRSWDWLSVVSVSIFALRDVIRQVQINFKTPYNGKSHTSPAIDADISVIRAYLEEQKIQMYTPHRQNNEMTVLARDLMAAGAVYATTSKAYRKFYSDNRKAQYQTRKQPISSEQQVEQFSQPGEDIDEVSPSPSAFDYGEDVGIDMMDLAMDVEEFPEGMDPSEFVNFITDAVNMF